MTLLPIILAGGKGERFWPVSRRKQPKQFLCLDGSGKSLLQATAERLLPLAGDWNRLWVITSDLIADGVREQLPELPETNLLIEPEGKDTAPAVAWGTIEVSQKYGKESIIGFFPADHWIENQSKFEETLQTAAELASTKETIVTLGITPNYPSTGYGYIEQGELIKEYSDLNAYKVARFTEKPNRETAEDFIKTGKFSWNSGMFIFKAGVMLEQLQNLAPEIMNLLLAEGKLAYSKLEKKSIDYAVMEKTQLAAVIPANFGWDDLGDWNALERLVKNKVDESNNGNVELANHLPHDTSGAIVYSSSSDDLVVTIGLEDVVIVRDRHVTLVVNKHRTQEIKKVLQKLKADPQYEHFL